MKRPSNSPMLARHRLGDRALAASDTTSAADVVEPESTAPNAVPKLFAGEHYFGLEAMAFHVGARRMLDRIAKTPPNQQRVDLRSLAEDFCVAGVANSALLSALLGGGLLIPDGAGRYRPTALFTAYATACVVAPLSRERARTVLGSVAELATRINSGWTRNPYAIDAIAVSGGFMSRRDPVNELSLWLVVRPRGSQQARGLRGPLEKDSAVRKMGKAIKSISSFIDVHVTDDRQCVSRPFAIVFQTSEEAAEACGDARARPWARALASLIRMKK